MILAVDIGNTNTTYGLFQPDGELVFRAALETRPNDTRDRCAIDLREIFTLYRADLTSVTGVIISSVVPPLTSAVSAAIKMLTGQTPMVVGPGIRTGLNIRAEVAGELGSDIVACAVAAIQKYPTPLILIDMGTATTMSVISGENSFEGCVIIPGAKLALEALSANTAALPHIAIKEPPSILGRNTVDSMRAGTVYATAAMIDEMIVRLEEATAPVAAVVATGGMKMLLKKCRRNIVYSETLLLDGLYQIYVKNRPNSRRQA